MRIYHDGVPDWGRRNFLVLDAKALKEAWLDKELSFILLDVRPGKEAEKDGFIPGAVGVPEKALAKALRSFPPKKAKPPIVVYDGADGEAARRVAKRLLAAGYAAPRVLSGGYAAWAAAGYPKGAGAPAAKVAWAPKPKAGSISASEFAAFSRAVPEGILLVDARGEDEVAAKGMIRGAVNIPCEKIAERLKEIPKDREAVLYCNTGVMAEMGYNTLKERGYRARFLDAALTTRKDGTFTIAK